MNQQIYTHDDLHGENFDHMVERGYINIKFKTFGYWSDGVKLTMKRNFRGDGQWTVDVSHSSGGRDHRANISEIDAERNFAKTILAACDLADELMNRVTEFEQKHQAFIQSEIEQSRIAQELQMKKIAEDTRMTDSDAQKVLDALEKVDIVIGRLYDPGSDYAMEVKFSVTRPTYSGQRTVYRIGSNRVSKEFIKTYLTQFSNRSTLVF